MNTKLLRTVWRLDRDGWVSPKAGERDWRVVTADRDRMDPTADYRFCAPDFLFPADPLERALRLEIDPRPVTARKATRSARR